MESHSFSIQEIEGYSVAYFDRITAFELGSVQLKGRLSVTNNYQLSLTEPTTPLGVPLL